MKTVELNQRLAELDKATTLNTTLTQMLEHQDKQILQLKAEY